MKQIPATIPLWSSSPEIRLELYLPTKPVAMPVPLVIVCPGGCYGFISETEAKPIATRLNEDGYAAAVLYYRVAPHGFPAPYSDACRAVRLMRSRAEEWNLDPGKIALMGFSAGGHLSALVGTSPELYLDPADDLAGKVSARPDGIILCYPVISMTEFANELSVRNLLGEDVSMDKRRLFSLDKRVTRQTPPVFLWHTAKDDPVPPENSLTFAAACVAHEVPLELHIFPGGYHGMNLALEDSPIAQWSALLIKWLGQWAKR
ncbi:MAG: alpha/beta hydrolase [Verrucomicrobiota bacterium]|nr:alpha/beta hydrolase [Verrucomicrobiota bacterium]